MKRVSISLSAGFLLASLVTPASAQVAGSQIVKSVSVRSGDLDLRSKEGAKAMLARLDAAAAKACGGKPAALGSDALQPTKHSEFRRCKAAAMESSTLGLGAPLVRAAWLEHRPTWAARSQPMTASTR